MHKPERVVYLPTTPSVAVPRPPPSCSSPPSWLPGRSREGHFEVHG